VGIAHIRRRPRGSASQRAKRAWKGRGARTVPRNAVRAMTARRFDARLDSHLWRGDRWRNGEGVVWSESRRRRRKQSRRGLNAEAGAKAEARSQSKGERDRGPRITVRRGIVWSSACPLLGRESRDQSAEAKETARAFRRARERDGGRSARVVGMKIAKRTHATTAATTRGTRVPGRPRGGPRRRIVPAPGRRSLDAHEHEGRRTTERPIGRPTRRRASATEQFS
jgi:hypothetical protein